jgi:uncharacterized membrane protein YtjA (UPF0391 family)
MSYWSAVFFAIAVIAGSFGVFGGEQLPAQIVWMLFFVGLILFVLSLLLQRQGPPDTRQHGRSGNQ